MYRAKRRLRDEVAKHSEWEVWGLGCVWEKEGMGWGDESFVESLFSRLFGCLLNGFEWGLGGGVESGFAGDG